jgi:hypothetical protein
MALRQSAASNLEKLNTGLSFSGAHLCGVSLPNCLEAHAA